MLSAATCSWYFESEQTLWSSQQMWSSAIICCIWLLCLNPFNFQTHYFQHHSACLQYLICITFLKTHLLVTPLPAAHCMESPAVFHRGGNPRRQETAGEASRCSQTPAHPGKNKRWQPCCLLGNHLICISTRGIDSEKLSISAFSPASSDLLGSCTLCRFSSCSRSSPRRSQCLWGTYSCHLCWEGFADILLRIFPNGWDSNGWRLVLPADQNLFRLESVGCHDPGCHSEHDCFSEDGRFGETLSKHNSGYKPTPSYVSRFLSPGRGAAAVVSGADVFVGPHPLRSAISFIL